MAVSVQGPRRRGVALLALLGALVFLLALYVAWTVRAPAGHASTHASEPTTAAATEPASQTSPAHAAPLAGLSARPRSDAPKPPAPLAAPSSTGAPGTLEPPPELQKPAGTPIGEPVVYDNTPATLIHAPAGGFDAWTGLENTHPGQVEMYARSEETSLEVAKELRRLHWLTTLTMDFNMLADIMGKSPGPEMEAHLRKLGNDSWEAGAAVYLLAHDKKLGLDDARDQLAKIEQDFRAAYLLETGLSTRQLDGFFAKDRDLTDL